MTNAERIRRLARAQGITADATTRGARLWADTFFAFDPAWFRHVAGQPATVLTMGGRPVLANLPAGTTPTDPVLTVIDYDARPALYNHALRKREVPFVEPLLATTVADIERRAYYGAYKGVTDLLTKWLWPEMAFALTKVAARIGLSPNGVTAIGAILCVIATYLFATGHYWPGLALGFVFMVLDTVDGKLARCTITSSWWGNLFDHGIDLIHPPIWWWVWGLGTRTTAHPLSDTALGTIMAVILAGYVLQRVVEGAFIKAFGMHIHVWREVDTDFRLVIARRNPNVLILFVSLAAARPDLGLIAVAWWTAISFAVQVLQLLQGAIARRRGPLRSWMED